MGVRIGVPWLPAVLRRSPPHLARLLARFLAVGGVKARGITRQLARLIGCQCVVLSPRAGP